MKNPPPSFAKITHLLHHSDGRSPLADMYDMAMSFGQEYLAPFNKSLNETNQHIGRTLWRAMGQHDLHGITVPEEYGGLNLGYQAHYVITEGLSYHCGSAGLSYIAHSNLCCNQITLNGSDEQKKRFLPKLVSGEFVGALAMSEPNAGSDVMGMSTTATKVDGGYILNGSKTWITNGGDADVVIVYANTGDGKKTAFLVEKGTNGFSAGPDIDKMGMRGSQTSPLYFDNCFIPDADILGQPNKGTAVLMSGLNYERLILSAGAVGIAQNSADIVQQYGETRYQFGRPLITNQSYAHQIGAMHGDLEMVRIFGHTAAQIADTKKLDNGMAANVFLQSSTIADGVTGNAIVLAGGMGYTRDMPLEQNHRDAKLYQIGGGAREIQEDVRARCTSGVYDQWVKVVQDATKQIDFSDPYNPKLKTLAA